ncbi:MAG: carboxypeptidase-like regulatory domain-containing protein, partial [Saprospiraceae bacterium]|nr:carboxypeptidase-like regulatory domain-containing protein [Saprospiraceae bacterium]
MKKIIFLIIICNLIIVDLRAQIIQNIRGKIYEANTENLLLGANIQLFDLQGKFISGAISDENGAYKISNIPIGKYNLMISYTGYEKASLPNIEVNAGKELIIDVALEESVTQLDAKVEIIADNVNKAVNESAIISTVSFNQVESEKYAGSRSDIARMAANYAGVMGADDSRNDIVVRGNSPANLIWRLEGVEIYNPNHFNIAGTQGGPVTIINSKYIGKSDFFTGAFPAEYGNSTSAVFDLRLKNGNNEKHEFSAQLGIIGAELFAEGPLNKSKKSNYWINYRYSTVSLLQKVGINIGTNSKTSYQDLAFKLQFPFKNNAYLNFFGIGGKSSSDILISDQTEPTDEIDIYAENDRDQYFKSKMALLGVSFSKSFANDKTYFKTTLIGQAEGQDVVHNLIFRHLDTANKYVYDSLPNLIDYTFAQHKISLGSYVNHKLNVHWLLKGGVNADLMFYDFIDSARASEHPFIDSVINPLWSKYYIRWDSKGAAFLIQPYIQTTWRPTNKLKFIFGLHSQIFTYNNDVSPIEPRASTQYIISNSQNISFGTGLYSQINPIYLTEFRDPSLPYGNTFYN